MGRLFARASSEFLNLASAPATAAPVTFACWFRSTDITVDQCLIAITEAATANNHFALEIYGSVAGDPVVALTRAAGASSSASTSTGYSANTWHHACAVFASATSRTAYIDGGSSGTNATSRTPALLDVTNIGRKVAGATNYMSGDIAEAAIWSAALDAGEVAGLAKGWSPIVIRPISLILYVPIVRGLFDIIGGVSPTATGTAVSVHPRVIPNSTQKVVPSYVAGSGGTTRWFFR